MSSAFLEALSRELAALRRDVDVEDQKLAGLYPNLTVTFNATKYRNSECAWTMNTNNVWDRWRL